MRISDLNTIDQVDDGAPPSVVLHTILPPPLLEHLGHGDICKLPGNIPRWTWWQTISARKNEKQKEGREEARLQQHWWYGADRSESTTYGI